MGGKTSKSCYDAVMGEDEEAAIPDRLGLICKAKEVTNTIDIHQSQFILNNACLSFFDQDFQRGNVFFRESNFDQAKAKYTTAISKLLQCEDLASTQPPVTTITNTEVIHFAQKRFEQANTLQTQAIKLHNQYSHILPDISLCALTIALKQDIFSHPIPLSEQAFVAELKEHGNIDSIAADLLNNLGACCEVRGDLEQARLFHILSLQMRKVVFGARSRQSAESLQNLATVLDALHHTEEAGQLLTEALSIEEEAHGLDSVQCSVTLNNLGVLSAHLLKLPLAHSLLHRAYNIRLRTYGRHHHLTLCAKRNLDCVAGQLRDKQACQERQKRESGREKEVGAEMRERQGSGGSGSCGSSGEKGGEGSSDKKDEERRRLQGERREHRGIAV